MDAQPDHASRDRRSDPGWILFCYSNLFGRARALALAGACQKIAQRRDCCLRSAEAHAARDPGADEEGVIAHLARTARIRAILYTIVLECFVAEIRSRDKLQRLYPTTTPPDETFVAHVEDAAREVAVARFNPVDAALPELEPDTPTDMAALHRLNAIGRAWTSLDLAIHLLTEAVGVSAEDEADPKEWDRFTYGVIRQEASA